MHFHNYVHMYLRTGLPDGLFFRPKIPVWVNFGGPWSGKYWYILRPYGIFYGHLLQFTYDRLV
jgi:hypothetical protein